VLWKGYSVSDGLSEPEFYELLEVDAAHVWHDYRAWVEVARAAVVRRDELERELAEAEKKYRQGSQKWVDGTCHYRNLAIQYGAKPEEMLDKYDRELAENHNPNDPDGWEHDTVELWQELEAAEAARDELETALREIAARPFTAALDAREMQAIARAVLEGRTPAGERE
jgi:hypothetical protein